MDKKLEVAINKMLNEYEYSVELLERNRDRHSADKHDLCCRAQSSILGKLRDVLTEEQRERLTSLDKRAFQSF